MQIQRYGIRWRRLSTILISHMHGDHYFGLPGLINSMSLMGRKEPVHLFAPASLEAILNEILRVADTVLSFPLIFHPLPQEAATLVETPALIIRCFPVLHRIVCHGFSVTEKNKSRKLLPDQCQLYNIPVACYEQIVNGADYISPDGSVIGNQKLTTPGRKPRCYAYCADTMYTNIFLDHVKGVDVMYHESTYLMADEAKAIARYHSTARQAAQMALDAGVGLLLLGHFSSKYKDLKPFHTEASLLFPNVELAEEGAVFEI